MNAEPMMPGRFQRVLFCTDFSESAQHAFGHAVDTVRRHAGSTLHVLHVMHEADAQFWRTYLAEVDNVEEESRRVIDEKLRTDYVERVPAGTPVVVEVRGGPAAPVILGYAQEVGADLIVLGRHGHGGMSQALFGSVASKVVRKSAVPVLVIPPG